MLDTDSMKVNKKTLVGFAEMLSTRNIALATDADVI